MCRQALLPCAAFPSLCWLQPQPTSVRGGVIQRYGRKHGIAVPISDVVVPLLAAGSEGPG